MVLPDTRAGMKVVEMSLEEYVEMLHPDHRVCDEFDVLKKDFANALAFLREAKAKWCPTTDNSDADVFLKKYEEK